MLNKEQQFELIDKLVSQGRYYTVVTIISEEEGLTRFANSEIHQNVEQANQKVKITVYNGKKESSITSNILCEDSLLKDLRTAEENLAFVPEGDFELPMLTEPLLIEHELADKELKEKYNIQGRAKAVKEGVSILPEGFSAFGALSLIKSNRAIGNNKGVKRFLRQYHIDFSVIVTHETDSSGFAHCITQNADELDIVKEFRTALEKSRAGINPQSVEPGAYTVILEPMAVGGLLNYMNYKGFSGMNVHMKTSFLTGKIGQKVLGDNITIIDDPENPDTFPAKFDTEGYQKKRLTIIDKGVAKDLVYDVKSAAAIGAEPTGHGTDEDYLRGGAAANLVMEAGQDDYEDLIKSTKRGILVTRFHYINTLNQREIILTGLTRDGAFLIEDGKITCGLKNLRFTESMVNAFNKVVGITKTRKKVPGFMNASFLPALKIEDFHFTGKTE